MTSKAPPSHLYDLICVLRGVQRVTSASVKLTSESTSAHPVTTNVVKLGRELTDLNNIRSGVKSLQSNERTELSNVLSKSGLVLENAVEFAKAKAKMEDLGIDFGKDFAKDLGKVLNNFDFEQFRPARDSPTETRAEPVGKEANKPEEGFELNPEVSSLELLKVDFTDPTEVHKAAYKSKTTEMKPPPEVVPQVSSEKTSSTDPVKKRHLTKNLSDSSSESKVPTSRFGRIASFGSLGIGLGFGVASEASKRALGLSDATSSSVFLSDANAERIVRTLCRVRGAALKIGQMMSIQDEALINPQLAKIFERVRESADFMPTWQMESVLATELGAEWRETHFSEFSDRPFAAASIGQVHSGTLLKDDRWVAVKIQYPGVADGIESDIKNLLGILGVANILPEGLFIDTVIKHMKIELAQECDYEREAECCRRMKRILQPYPDYYVPEVINEVSTKQVLTTEMIEGLTIDQCMDLSQETRNRITKLVLELLLRELFIHRYMQTDPNWANFLYNPHTQKLGLIDFGATREFRPFFVNNYFKIIDAASKGNKDDILEYSKVVGFLSGYEAKEMKEAHVESVMILGECFRENRLFNFGVQNTTQRMHELVQIMLKHRLRPPPPEVYSLHRKMSGLFLLAAKLKAELNAYDVWQEIRHEYRPHQEE